MVAGEASGDLLGANLLQALRAHWPNVQASGIGGARMVQQGFTARWPSEKLAVRGYVEVLRHYREIAGIRNSLRAELTAAHRPDLFIGIDAPDFNLDLELALKAGGIKTIHYVCPSIWAWRAKRVEKIQRAADHVLCIFPFEPELLARHSISSTYVGHPLAGMIPMQADKAAARKQLGLQDHDTVVAILPGSRRSEVRYLAERFFRAARILQGERPALKFVVPAMPALKAAIESAAHAAGLHSGLTVFVGRSHEILAACDVTLIASGTATLEAALFKRPMVIAYYMNALSWQIMRRKQLQPWVGLPNILAGELLVPELLQANATPEALARATLEWLDAPDKARALEVRFAQMHRELLRDTATLATHAIEKVLAR